MGSSSRTVSGTASVFVLYPWRDIQRGASFGSMTPSSNFIRASTSHSSLMRVTMSENFGSPAYVL